MQGFGDYGRATDGLILRKLLLKIEQVGQSCAQLRHASAKMLAFASGDNISPPIKSSISKEKEQELPF
ncbi:hypothetical protein RB195_011349 [Necator americanus]|uniref:Uncharacterized protein n=1 Tax=Necator americanus TaxID=51031 RepID=A0ABR1D218_NECAM